MSEPTACAQGIEDGGLILNGHAYGLCPGYPGLAEIWLYQSTTGTFTTGKKLPAPGVRVVDGVSFFIDALPQSACDYPSLELNATSPGVSDEHNLGFGGCTTGKLVPINESQGIWQLPAGHWTQNFS